ncbi:MAG TPA: hypothetical protein VEW69_06270, partial [Alphaproteobacteria bacterium]|nr:hypothetical protein [Alphaproteobacteria bacterium]
ANELIVDPYGKYNAHDVGPWAINARPCHKWTLDNPLRSYAPELMKPAEVCINAQHQLLLFDQSGYKWEFYDYGAPIEINPPDGWTEQ